MLLCVLLVTFFLTIGHEGFSLSLVCKTPCRRYNLCASLESLVARVLSLERVIELSLAVQKGLQCFRGEEFHCLKNPISGFMLYTSVKPPEVYAAMMLHFRVEVVCYAAGFIGYWLVCQIACVGVD